MPQVCYNKLTYLILGPTMLLRTMWQTNCRYEFVRITEVTADRLLRAACESCDAGASLTQMLLPIYGCFLMPVTQC